MTDPDSLTKPAPAPVGKLRTVARAVWALSKSKKVIVALVAMGLGAVGITVPPATIEMIGDVAYMIDGLQ